MFHYAAFTYTVYTYGSLRICIFWSIVKTRKQHVGTRREHLMTRRHPDTSVKQVEIFLTCQKSSPGCPRMLMSRKYIVIIRKHRNYLRKVRKQLGSIREWPARYFFLRITTVTLRCVYGYRTDYSVCLRVVYGWINFNLRWVYGMLRIHTGYLRAHYE